MRRIFRKDLSGVYRTQCRAHPGTGVGSTDCRKCPSFMGIMEHGTDRGVVDCREVPRISDFDVWRDTPEGSGLYGSIPAEPYSYDDEASCWADIVWWYYTHEEDIFNAGMKEGLRISRERKV